VCESLVIGLMGHSSTMTTRVLQIITAIDHVPDTRSAYCVVLACDHWRIATNRDVERERSFVGKAVACGECGQEGQYRKYR
jgi:hypothetical protein